MEAVKLDKDKFRLGHTKVFFRAGINGWMEEQREKRIGAVLSWLQAGARGKQGRQSFKKLADRKQALYTIQRAVRGMVMAKTWPWMTIWLAIKPTLRCTQFTKFEKEYKAKIAEAEGNIGMVTREYDVVLGANTKIHNEMDELNGILNSGGAAVQAIIDKTQQCEEAMKDTKKQLTACEARVLAEEENTASIVEAQKKVEAETAKFRSEMKKTEAEVAKCEEDKASKDSQIATLGEEVQHQNELIAKLQKEKKEVGEGRQKVKNFVGSILFIRFFFQAEEDIQSLEDRGNHLAKVKGKLEQSLDEAEDALEREKKSKGGECQNFIMWFDEITVRFRCAEAPA